MKSLLRHCLLSPFESGALILFALGAEMGERVAALAGAGLAVFVLIRRLMRRNEEGSISKAGRN